MEGGRSERSERGRETGGIGGERGAGDQQPVYAGLVLFTDFYYYVTTSKYARGKLYLHNQAESRVMLMCKYE